MTIYNLGEVIVTNIINKRPFDDMDERRNTLKRLKLFMNNVI